MNSFYSDSELKDIGFGAVGENVLISKKASIYSPDKITVGNNVRVDDFCILSGNIEIGSNVHIAAYSALYGGTAGIMVCDFANISSRVCVYAVSDDFSGEYMTNPTIPDKYKNVLNAPVVISRHVIIGSGSTVLPGVTLEEGTAVGAMSLCKKSTEPWTIYAGIPAEKLKQRDKNVLALERCFLNERN